MNKNKNSGLASRYEADPEFLFLQDYFLGVTISVHISRKMRCTAEVHCLHQNHVYYL